MPCPGPGIDSQLMYFFNVKLANPIFDIIMPFITNGFFVLAFFLSFAILAAVFGGRYGRITFLILLLAIALTDPIASQVIKPIVGRLRPCRVMDCLNVLVHCSQGKSFPSAHAANSFGQAIVWTWRYPKFKWFFLIAAAAISYSRIAVGVHYPFDVLAGAILGTLLALFIILVFTLIKRQVAANKGLDKTG